MKGVTRGVDAVYDDGRVAHKFVSYARAKEGAPQNEWENKRVSEIARSLRGERG